MATSERAGRLPPEYYYDVVTQQLLVGKCAVDAYIEAGGHPANIVDAAGIGRIIRGDDPISSRGYYGKDFSKWTTDDVLKAWRIIKSFLPQPENPAEKFLNERVINRANLIGLIPSKRQIADPSRFGSSSNFYIAADEPSTLRKFHGLTQEDLVEYISELTNQLGHIPTESELYEISKLDPSKPSYEVLRRRAEGGKSGLARELGYVNLLGENRTGYVRWGIEAYIANEGVLPSQDETNIMSTVDRAPGVTNTRRRFKAKADFLQAVFNEYEALSSKLQKGLESGDVPNEIFENVRSLRLRFGRYSRWVILDGLVEGSADLKITIVKADIDDDKFLALLEIISSRPEKIDSKKQELGVLRSLWRYSYMDSLQVENATKTRLDMERGSLDAAAQYEMDRFIQTGVSFLDSRNLRNLVAIHFTHLREGGLLPAEDRFKELFINESYFRILVKSRQKSIKEGPGLQLERQNARDRLRNFYNIALNFERFIGNAGVEDEVYENGNMIIRLAAINRRENPVMPGSPEAEAVIEKVAKELRHESRNAKQRRSDRSISGTKGHRRKRAQGQKRSIRNVLNIEGLAETDDFN